MCDVANVYDNNQESNAIFADYIAAVENYGKRIRKIF